jgi:signal transduction histidine kinase
MSTVVDAIAVTSPVRRGADRLWQVLGSVNVRTKILGIVLFMTVALGLAVTWQVRTVMVRVFLGELDTRGFSVASDLAARSADPILLNDTYALYQLIHETVANHPDALYAYVQEADGRILAHTFGDAGFPTALLDPEVAAKAVIHVGSTMRHLAYATPEGIVHEFTAPILSDGRPVVHLGLSETRLSRIVNATTGQMLFTTLLVALGGIAAATVLTWLLTRPILALVATARQVGQGNLRVRAEPWADDEIGDLAHAFNQMVADLAASHGALADKEQARTLLLKKLITAQEEERRRIARELHDGVGQVLTSLIVGNQMAAQMEDRAAAQRKNQEMVQIATETLQDVRMLSRQLRPSLMDDLGLAVALDRYAQDFAHLYPTMNIDLHYEARERLPELAEITLYRIIQEAMTNAARHSGGTYIGVLVTQRNGHVQAIVEDNGAGFDPAAARKAGQSVGIHAMAERAELIGGRLDIESNPQGTTVYIGIPL